MNQQFTPRKVKSGSWRKWSQQALELQSRLKFANIMMSLLCVVYYMYLVEANNIYLTILSMLVAAPLSLSLFVVLAAYADGKKILPATNRLRVLLRLLFFGIVNWVLLFLILASLYMFVYMVSELFGLSLSVGDNEASAIQVVGRSGSVFTNPYLFLAALVYTIIPLAAWYAQSLIPYISIWFVLLLTIVTPLNIVESYTLSWQAEKMNLQEVNSLSMLALGLLSLILVSGGILALIVLPYLGSLMYVSFRDVFLKQSENSMLASSQLVTHSQPQHL